MIVKFANVNTANYEEATKKLLACLNLDNIQVASYSNFLENSIDRLLSKPIIGDGFTVKFNNWWIDTSSTYPLPYCKEKHLTYEATLKASITITFNQKFSVKCTTMPNGTSITANVDLTKIPILTNNGNFCINGVDKVMISHLEKADKLVISPPLKEGVQFGQLELRNSSKGILVLDSDIIFKNIGSSSNYYKYSYSKALQQMGYLDDIQNITGISKHLGCKENSSTLSLIDDKKTIDVVKALSMFDLNVNERLCVNIRTSFGRNLVDKTLADDLTLEINGTSKIIPRGTKLTCALGKQIQEAGIKSVYILDQGSRVPVYNNGFVDTEPLFKSANLPIPKALCVKARNPLYTDQQIVYHVQCNRDVFISLLKEYGHDRELLIQQLELNVDELLGTTLTENDLFAIINLFARTINTGEYDDIDSLENKKIVNIDGIFSDVLVDALTGKTDSLVTRIKKLRKDASNASLAESGKDLILRLNIDLLNCKEKTIAKATNKLPLLTVEDSTNPLAQNSNKRKITLAEVPGRGGVSAASAGVTVRSVNPSYSGRIDCIDTPESKVVGLVRQIGTLAYPDEFGQLLTPFFRIDKEKKKIDLSEIHYLTYGEELCYRRILSPRIASKDGIQIYYYKDSKLVHNEFFNTKNTDAKDYERLAKRKCQQCGYTKYKLEIHKKDWFIDDQVLITYGHGKTELNNPDTADFISCSGTHIFAPVASSVPFLEYNDAVRGEMACSMGKQAIAIWGKGKQLVKTPMANLISRSATGVILAPYDLTVLEVDGNGILVSNLYTEETEYIPCLRLGRTSKTTLNQATPTVKVDDVVLEGEVLADNSSTIDGELAHGRHLRVCVAMFYGSNYEDGVIISHKLLADDILTSFHIEEVTVKIGPNQQATKSEFRSNSKLTSNRFNDNVIIKAGTQVNPEDIIACKMVTKDLKKEGRVVGTTKEAVFFKYEGSVPGTVVDVATYEEGADIIYTIKIAVKLKMGCGDKYSGRHGNKGITCSVLPEEDMPYLENGDRFDIIVNPLGIPSRMNIGQTLEGHAGELFRKFDLVGTIQVMNNFNVDLFKEALEKGEVLKQQVFDGRTGRPLRYKTAVMFPYNIKLEHVVEHKIHVRTSYPYTRRQQPTQGKSSNGGQRFGEMEFWSSASHGCSNVQREIVQYKSDDVNNRKAFDIAFKDADEERLAALQNRKSNVPHAYLLSDIYYKSMMNILRYYDADGNEIDISRPANHRNRIMAPPTQAEIESGITESQVASTLQTNVGLDILDVTDDMDNLDDFGFDFDENLLFNNIEQFDKTNAGDSNMPTPVISLPSHLDYMSVIGGNEDFSDMQDEEDSAVLDKSYSEDYNEDDEINDDDDSPF